jgi:hypothetical protein
MRLGGFAAPAEQSECGLERRPPAVPVLSASSLQGQTLGLCLELPLPLPHERQVLCDVLGQHVLPSFHGIANKNS